MGGTMQIEIAEVLEPLYRAGEEWEKLHQIHEVQLGRVTDVGERQALLRRLAEIAEHKLVDQVAAFGWWAEAVKEDPSSSQALDELLRLGRATHQWDAFVTTMSEAASADRPPEVRRDVLLRLGASFESDLGDLERAEKALLAVLNEHDKDHGGAGLARSHLREPGDVREPGGCPAPANRHHRRQRRAGGASTCASARSTPRRWRSAIWPSPATWRCWSTRRSRGRRSTRSSGSTSAASAGASSTASTRRSPRLTSDEMGLADCYARMAKLAADALDNRAKAVELWGKVVDIRGEDAIALSGLADLHEMAGEWKPLTEVLDKQVAATVDDRGEDPDLQAARAHLGREAVARAQLARELAEGPGDRSAGRRRAPRDRRQLPQRGRLGRAVAGAAPADPGRPAGWQRHRERRIEGAVRAARRARGRDPHAHAGRDRRLARGPGAGHGRLPRAGGARAPVHAGGALGRGGRHPRTARGGAGQSDGAGRRPHAGGVALGRQDRRRRLGGAGLRARAADRSGAPDGLRSSWSSSIASARAG